MSILVQVNALWRVPLILLWTGAMATLSLVLSPLDRSGRLQHWCARTWSRFILWVSRVRVETEGLEALDPHRPWIIMANHLSMFDHWAFLACLPFQFRFAAKASLFRIPFLGWQLKQAGNIAIDPHQHRATLRAFQEAAQRVGGGMSFVIYPEGGRTFGEGVAPFKRGSFLLARYAHAPIVPVTIIGAHRRLRRGSVLIHPGRMRLIFHPPIEFKEYGGLGLEELSERVRRPIVRSYRQVPS